MFNKIEPEKEFEELVQLKEKAYSLRMESENEDTDISEEELVSVLCKFQSKKSTMSNFIITGITFKMAVVKICKRFLKLEMFPSCFDITTLIQLRKKESQVDLDNSRFIHINLWMPRLLEALAVGSIKKNPRGWTISDRWMSRPEDSVPPVCHQVTHSCEVKGW